MYLTRGRRTSLSWHFATLLARCGDQMACGEWSVTVCVDRAKAVEVDRAMARDGLVNAAVMGSVRQPSEDRRLQ